MSGEFGRAAGGCVQPSSTPSGSLMQSKATTAREYLAKLPADGRAAIESVRAVIRQHIHPVFEEDMQYGRIGFYVCLHSNSL